MQSEAAAFNLKYCISFKKMLIWKFLMPNGRITLTCVTLSMTRMLPRAVKTGRKTRERPQ